MSESVFAVPLSVLIDIQKKWGWEWVCRIDNPASYDKGCDCEINLDSESAARAAAVAHLESVHGIQAAGEENS